MPLDNATADQRLLLPSVRRSRHIAELCAIDQAEVNVAVLQRALRPQVRDDATRLSQCAGFQMLAVVTPDRRGKQDLAARLPESPYLAADLGFWVEVLADLVECCVVGVRLASVDHAMCARMHVDNVTLRVVSTYVGPGTQYLENSDVDRRFLGHAANGVSDESSGVLRPSALIHAAGSGDIVLLKGERWPGNRGRGAVHRSPLASAARPRLVMTLDPLGN